MTKRYTDAFKQKAVEQMLYEKQSAKKVAAEIGIDQSTLIRWRKNYGHENPLT